MNPKVRQYIKELDDQFQLVKKTKDDEIKSMLTQYLCIRVSGLLETFIKCRISDYALGRVPKEVKRFISGKFKDITNLRSEKLLNVLDSFSNDWFIDFNEHINDNAQQKTSLDSVVTNRHNIAHGQHQNISFKSMEQYYEDVKAVISKLELIIS